MKWIHTLQHLVVNLCGNLYFVLIGELNNKCAVIIKESNLWIKWMMKEGYDVWMNVVLHIVGRKGICQYVVVNERCKRGIKWLAWNDWIIGDIRCDLYVNVG